MPRPFRNRQDAGKRLAEALAAYANRKETIVLALPRGGVPIGYEIAKALHLPLDVFIVRKLGVPYNEELAMGALASGGIQVFNQEVIHEFSISAAAIESVIQKEQSEILRREKAYRGHTPLPQLAGKTIILVDDGIATGSTMRAAVTALKATHPAQIIIAVPVAAADVYPALKAMANDFIALLLPQEFYAVGAWYEEFPQTSDEEVTALLKKQKV